MAEPENNRQKEVLAELSVTLGADPIVSSCCSRLPTCSLFPSHMDPVSSFMVITAIVRDEAVTKVVIADLCVRIIRLIRPFVLTMPRLDGLMLWIVSGTTADTRKRILRLTLKPPSLEAPALLSLVLHLNNEYYEEGGFRLYRYCSM